MTVDDKIRFAEYFLDRIKDAKKREDFRPNFSAFLSETKSITDYLLQEYNLKFGLKIKYLTRKKFKEKAFDTMNLDALKFISTYNNKFDKLRQVKIAGYLLERRDIEVHEESKNVRGHFSRGMIESVIWEFDDYKDSGKDAVTLCEEYLNLMKRFVDDLNSEFPRK